MNNKEKIYYLVMTVSPVDYGRKNSIDNYQLCTLTKDDNCLWIAGDSGRINNYDTPTFFERRKDAVNAINRTNRMHKKKKIWTTPFKIIALKVYINKQK